MTHMPAFWMVRRLAKKTNGSLYSYHEAGSPQKAAHKTGGLSDIAHDAGILYGEKRTLVFAALATAPSDAQCIAFLQALSPHVMQLL